MLNFRTATVAQLIDEATMIENEVGAFYAALSPAQINWQPAPDSWSVGQCLQHICMANEGYFVDFAAVTEGRKQHTFWERLPLLPRLIGPLIISGLTPGQSRPIPTPPGFMPRAAAAAADLLDRFRAQQRRIVGYLSTTRDMPLERIIVTSPAVGFVAYPMLDAYRIMIVHERLHQVQMEAVAAAQRAIPV